MTLKKRNILLLLLLALMQCSAFAQAKYWQTGTATYYADYFQGRRTTSGEIYNKALYTAAHPSLPFQTLVKITNLNNNLYVIVKINDRCPWHRNRIIDLSKAAAKKLDMILAGRVNVTLEEITAADLNIISQEPDTVIKLVFPDSSLTKNLFKSKIYYKEETDMKFFREYRFANITEFGSMIKPEDPDDLKAKETRF